MEQSEILSKVDHTVLKATTTWADVEKICKEALKYKMASVCIPPSFVARAHEVFPDVNLCAAIGFPLGYNSTKVKVAEAEDAFANGANEIDMVVNLGYVKDGDFDKVTEEIVALKKVCVSHSGAASKDGASCGTGSVSKDGATSGSTSAKILKVIIETCYLTEDEKIKLCECVTKAGADFIKTSTGFGSAGAQLSDIELFKKHIGANVKIKAAGGIRTREEMEAFISAGCSRIGCSAALTALGLE